MFGWFLRIMESFQAYKKRKAFRNMRRTRRKESLKQLQGKETNKEGVKGKKKAAIKERAKLALLRIVRVTVQFIESVILWIIGILGLHLTLIMLAGIVVLVVILSIIASVEDGSIIDSSIDTPPSIESTQGYTELRWTQDELEKYQHYYTGFEKNLFKIAILTKGTVNGYGFTDKFKTVMDKDVEYSLFRMSLGVQTTETNWRMYVNDKATKDVFIDPSDVDMEGGIQGPYQMGPEWTFANAQLSEEIKAKIKSTYTNPLNGGDRHYYPYATAISVSGTYNKMNEQGLNKSKYTDIFKRIAPSFGITTDYDRFEAEAIVMLMQTAYLSAPLEYEREGVCAVITGMWAISSDDPAKRSFDNYELDFSNGLDLSTTNHQQYFGVSPSSTGWTTRTAAEVGDLRNLKFGSIKTIKLNGEYLDKPLIAEVVGKYWEIPEIQAYNKDVIDYSREGNQFVLKGIYGIESFLVGKQIVDYLGSKLPMQVVDIKKGEFRETPGVGQGNWGGKTIEELSKDNTGAMQFKQYWGTSYAIKTGNMEEWRINDRWGVPFYYQSDREEHRVRYGVINWHTSKGSLNACAFYMSAYMASALTGDMINSTEMASALIVTNGVNNRGLYMNDGARVTFDLLGINFRQFNESTKAEVLKTFGLQIKNPHTLWADRWYYIDEILAQGGIVGVSVNSASVFTRSGHYMVISGKDSVTGKYTIYSSSSAKQTNTLYDRAAFDGKLRSHRYFFAKLK